MTEQPASQPSDPTSGEPLPTYSTPYAYGAPYQAAPPTNGMAIAALVTSLAMLFACMPLSVIGAIFGHIARRQIRERGESGDGMALAGIIVGWIGLALTVLLIGFFVILGLSGAFDDSSSSY